MCFGDDSTLVGARQGQKTVAEKRGLGRKIHVSLTRANFDNMRKRRCRVVLKAVK